MQNEDCSSNKEPWEIADVQEEEGTEEGKESAGLLEI